MSTNWAPEVPPVARVSGTTCFSLTAYVPVVGYAGHVAEAPARAIQQVNECSFHVHCYFPWVQMSPSSSLRVLV